MPAPSSATAANSSVNRSSEVNMDPKSEIVIRPANPTFEEGLAYAKFLDQAADGFIRFMLGAQFADVIADTFATPAHDFSFENVLVAERDAVILGTAAGYTAQQHFNCSDEELTKARGFPALRMSLVQLVFGGLWRFLNTIESSDFYLQSIAIDSECRGEGIGPMLIDAMEKRAANTKATRFVLDVAETNENARRLYERRGMTVQSRWPRRLPIPWLRVLRMAKPLRKQSCAIVGFSTVAES